MWFNLLVEIEILQSMYEKMKVKVEEAVVSGNVYPNEKWAHVFNHWDADFTRSNHPTVIQVLFFVGFCCLTSTK